MVSHRASKRLVLFTVIAVLSASVGAASDAPQRLPNIVYIRADDLGYGDLGCYNRDSKIPTPHMDRLAAEGMRFLDAHSVASVCTPTRYGILTGRYAWRTPMKTGGLFGYSAPLINTWRITVPSLLKRHGYQTGCVGKWHLGLDWSWHKYEARPDFSEPIRVGPLDYGFDYFFGIAASADMPPFISIENNLTVGLPTESVKWFRRRGLALPGFKVVDVMPTLARKAIERIEAHAQNTPGKPFFLYFSLTAPHIPVVPPEFVTGKSQAGRYGDFVHLVDWTVGQVTESLEAHGLAENTLVILTSDNGGRIWVPADERVGSKYSAEPKLLVISRFLTRSPWPIWDTRFLIKRSATSSRPTVLRLVRQEHKFCKLDTNREKNSVPCPACPNTVKLSSDSNFGSGSDRSHWAAVG